MALASAFAMDLQGTVWNSASPGPLLVPYSPLPSQELSQELTNTLRHYPSPISRGTKVRAPDSNGFRFLFAEVTMSLNQETLEFSQCGRAYRAPS